MMSHIIHKKANLTSSLFSVTLIVVLFFAICAFSLPYLNQKVYADGLTQENLPPATVGNRKASLFVKVSPPILTTDTKGNAFMQFRLFDANNNQTIQHVTYDIGVTKGTTSSKQQAPLLRDFFHAHNGLLTLKIQPSNGTLTIFGERDPLQSAWVADPGGSINIRGPLLLDGGLYHFHIEIFGIDNDRNIFIPDNAPKFDSYLSIGDVYRNKIADPDNGQKFNTTLISYYDKVNDFNFDPKTKQISWSMPFNWNLSRIKQQNIFVHEELRLPKSWKDFIGSGFAGFFNASVNGQPITGRALAIDPFSFPNALVLHYLLNKNELLKLAEENQNQNQNQQTTTSLGNSSVDKTSINGNNAKSRLNLVTANVSDSNRNASNNKQQYSSLQHNDIMLFTLRSNVASGNKTAVAASSAQTSSDLVTDTGSIHVAVSWSPNQLAPESSSTVKINFSDALTSGPLNTNVKYDLLILNKNGTAIIKKENLLAKNGTDSQTISFPAKEIYQIELHIKGLIKPGQTTDLTRNGIARGVVVVPEFAAFSTLLLIGSLFAIIVVIQRVKINPIRNVSD